MSGRINQTTTRCGLSAPNVAEKDKIMRKAKLSREDFCRLNNCSDDDYMILESIFRRTLETVVDVQLEEPIEGLAEPGDEIKLFMLIGGSTKLKTLWAKTKGPFEQQLRERFAAYFRHVDAKVDSTVKSHHDGDEDTVIVVLTNEERDRLLHKVWCREADVLKKEFKKGGDASPTKRRRITKSNTAPEKALRTTRLPNTPRLKNSVLFVWEVTPNTLTQENEKTDLCIPIPFSKFADDDDLDAVTDGQKIDLDPTLFSCKGFCQLVTESKMMDLTTGYIALTKARRRCDRGGRDKKHEWAFRTHREHKAEYYLEKMLKQMVEEAALDPNYTFELFFKRDAVWKDVDMPMW